MFPQHHDKQSSYLCNVCGDKDEEDIIDKEHDKQDGAYLKESTTGNLLVYYRYT